MNFFGNDKDDEISSVKSTGGKSGMTGNENRLDKDVQDKASTAKKIFGMMLFTTALVTYAI